MNTGKAVETALNSDDVYVIGQEQIGINQNLFLLKFKEPLRFIRGDANYDGKINISDPVSILNALFVNNSQFICWDAADANDDGSANITDAIYILKFLFQGGPPPLAPFPTIGDDPTPDNLFCGE